MAILAKTQKCYEGKSKRGGELQQLPPLRERVNYRIVMFPGDLLLLHENKLISTHVQNSVRVSAGGPTRSVNIAG